MDTRTGGDVDLAAVGRLVADPARCAMLLALVDGRALPAGRLAAEAGVGAATASSHLGKLTGAGLLDVEVSGRHRYYRLAGPAVARLLETLGQLAPVAPVRSLREGTRAAALRSARTCYDHLAGRLGVALMGAFLDRGWLAGGDGAHHPDDGDRLSAYGTELDYTITPAGRRFLDGFGVVLPPRRRVVRYCVDWTEQRHHLAGGLGCGLLDRLTALDWIRAGRGNRAVRITDAGHAGLPEVFGPDVRASWTY